MFPFTLPEPVAFLELIKKLEPPDNDSAEQKEFGRVWDCIVKWLELPQPENMVYARPIIVNIARRLKDHPRLLYGLNCILQPHCRIECLTALSTVTSYVLVGKGYCEIQSMLTDRPGFPSTKRDLEGIVCRDELWQEAVVLLSDTERQACIAQVLQEMIEDPLLEEGCRQATRKRLYRLGKMGILPPSIYIHFVTPPPVFESIIEHSKSGGFCDAHKITVNSVPLCFRVIRQWITSDSDKIYQQFCRELSVWRQLKHPNILPLIGATAEAFPRRYCFAITWMLHGSIMAYLKAYPDHDRYLAISQIVDGVDYLQGLNPPVSHKDLKGENVLVRSDLVCVITDFGLSRVLESQHSRTAGATGTMYWMPPELLDDDDGCNPLPRLARPRDVYSLGCTIAEILTGNTPKFIWAAVIRGNNPLLPPFRSLGWHQDELHLWELVRKCLIFEPEERPVIREVKTHLQVYRQSQPSAFEPTQPSPREVDRENLIRWINSFHIPTPLSDFYDAENPALVATGLSDDMDIDSVPPKLIDIDGGSMEGNSLGLDGGGAGGSHPLYITSFPDVDFWSVPPEHKKKGSDWFVLFNPKVKRMLDVNLVHTLVHKSVVTCVQFSVDGKYLATGCKRTAQIYKTRTGQKTCTLVDDTVDKSVDLYIRSVCFSPDGKYLATGAEDNQIRIWDIAKKRIRNVFDGHQEEIYSLDFSLDGRLIVSGSSDKTARIWDMHDRTSKVLAINDPVSPNYDAGVTSVAVSPDGQYVATGSLDSAVRIWDVNTAQLVERLSGHRDGVYSVAFTPDGKGLVSGSLDKTLKYWDVSGLGTGAASTVKGQNGGAVRGLQGQPSQCMMNLSGHKDYVLSAAVSQDGQWVVSGSRDRSVQFWDARNAVAQCMLQGHKDSVISVDLSPVGNVLATGGGDCQARIWSYATI